ncbi:AAA family ATPase [Brevibacterium casei]|nr:AAA family ATPase [Brevibacterium casei]
MNRYVVVTGTDTGVGKTVATAALAVRLRRAGHRVHIRKPAQTGLVAATDPRRSSLEASYTDVVTCGDAEIAARLSGAPSSTAVTLTLPMAPAAAAEHEGVVLPTPRDHAEAIVSLAHRMTEEAGVGRPRQGRLPSGPDGPGPPRIGTASSSSKEPEVCSSTSAGRHPGRHRRRTRRPRPGGGPGRHRRRPHRTRHPQPHGAHL